MFSSFPCSVFPLAQIGDAGLSAIARGCPLLEELSIEEDRVTDISLDVLSQHCPHLRVLSLAHCKGVTAVGLSLLAARCPRMAHLDISYCNRVSVEGLQNAIARWPLLVELVLRGHIADSEHHLLAHPGIQTLNLSWCKHLSDAAVAAITLGCPSLERLDLIKH